MKLVCHLNPAQFLDPYQQQILNDVGMDGHWLFSRIIDYLPEMGLESNLDRESLRRQVDATEDALRDMLASDIIDYHEQHGMNDDDLVRMERFLEEHLPDLAEPIENILDQLFVLLSNLRPPEHCLKKDLLHYLWGYEQQGNHAGILHFDFDEQ